MQPRALTKAVGAATPESLSAGIGHPKSSHTRAAGFFVSDDISRLLKGPLLADYLAASGRGRVFL
jgi:hypothetical protein